MSNNDLISREWLEDAFDNLCCHNCKTCRNFRIEDSFYKCALIDNAPIVEPEKILVANVTFDKDELNRLIDERVIEPIKNGELVIQEERPQGEWLWLCDTPNAKYKWSCNKCGRGVKEQENYCPNCGVKMKYNTEK